MRFLSGEEEKLAIHIMDSVATVADQSTCKRSKCGSIIITLDDNTILGTGFNSPPGNSPHRCDRKHELSDQFKSDKTCCVHAEQRAIMNVLSSHPQLLKLYKTRLYFLRLDENNQPKRSGQPYCTICSKMALDAGVTEFTLWHREGICVYDTLEYNELSFNYGKSKPFVAVSKIEFIGGNKKA